MKKLLVLATAFLIGSVTTASAQFNNPRLLLGPQLSLGHSWQNNLEDESFKFAPAFGAKLMYMQGRHLAWSASLMVSHEGYRTDIPQRVDGILRSRMHAVNPKYIRFTPKAVYMLREEGVRVRPMIGIGPSVAYKFDEVHWVNEHKLDAKEVIGSGDNDNRAPELIDAFDLGIDADAGVSVQVARNTWLQGSLGYYHGLMDARDFEDSENKNIRLHLALMFGL